MLVFPNHQNISGLSVNFGKGDHRWIKRSPKPGRYSNSSNIKNRLGVKLEILIGLKALQLGMICAFKVAQFPIGVPSKKRRLVPYFDNFNIKGSCTLLKRN